MITARTLQRISDGLDKAVIVFCVAVVLVMLSISTLGITLEVTFNVFELFGASEAFVDSPLDWIYSQTRPSMTRLFLPWLAMLSLTMALKRGEHVAIAMAIRNLRPGLLRGVKIINLVVVGLFGAAMVWYGYFFFENSTQLFMISDTLQVSHKWTALSVPVCGLIICVHLLSGVSLIEIHEFDEEVEE